MRKLFVFLFVFLMMNVSFSQSKIINLWDNIPNSKPTKEQEVYTFNGVKRIALVKEPTLEVFLPSKKGLTDKAVIICPGGGYRILSYDWEGTDIAKWFNSKGIAAFVLKSRLPTSKSLIVRHEAPLQDAQRAIRLVRNNAKEWGINPNKIGIMGFSAGGHLAASLGTQFHKPNNFNEDSLDTISAKPNFMMLIYPVISMQDKYTHKGSQNNLLGKNATETLKTKYSNELQVTQKTPPTFLVHSADDKAVPVANSLEFFKALNNNGVKAEIHIYPTGGHGYSLAIGKGRLATWPDRMYDWLQDL